MSFLERSGRCPLPLKWSDCWAQSNFPFSSLKHARSQIWQISSGSGWWIEERVIYQRMDLNAGDIRRDLPSSTWWIFIDLILKITITIMESIGGTQCLDFLGEKGLCCKFYTWKKNFIKMVGVLAVGIEFSNRKKLDRAQNFWEAIWEAYISLFYWIWSCQGSFECTTIENIWDYSRKFPLLIDLIKFELFYFVLRKMCFF